MDIAVIGLGLIGGSLTWALAEAGHTVLGYDLDPATRANARTAVAQVPADRRWIVARSVRAAVEPADLVVLAVPLPAVDSVLEAVARTGHSGLVTDVTSVKGPVAAMAARTLATASFVGGHPMAGRESAGFAAADPGLFRGCAWVLCLEPDRPVPDGWLTVARVVLGLGVRVVPATVAEHDRAVAIISHVPHLLAAALTTVAAADALALTLGAGAFRDGTRVAASPPALTSAMCTGNAEAVRQALDEVIDALYGARDALTGQDPLPDLRSWLAPAARVRAGWPARASEPATLPVRADVLLRLGQAGGWVTGVAADGRTVTAALPAG